MLRTTRRKKAVDDDAVGKRVLHRDVFFRDHAAKVFVDALGLQLALRPLLFAFLFLFPRFGQLAPAQLQRGYTKGRTPRARYQGSNECPIAQAATTGTRQTSKLPG